MGQETNRERATPTTSPVRRRRRKEEAATVARFVGRALLAAP